MKLLETEITKSKKEANINAVNGKILNKNQKGKEKKMKATTEQEAEETSQNETSEQEGSKVKQKIEPLEKKKNKIP